MPPKVSVCLVTYNHENYIRQCLDAILSQQVNFDFEIVIGEDKSTDNTLAIVMGYQQKYPEKISVIISEGNVGMVANWERTLMACKGKYIAIIEGDDCWINNEKLQKQTNLLDEHPEYALCFHGVEIEYGEGVDKESPLIIPIEGEELSIKDVILKDWFIPTCSMMIRAEYLSPFPAWTKNLKSIDIVVQLMVTMHGKIGYIKEKMGLYRIHSAGISQVQWLGKANAFIFSLIEIFKYFDAYSNGKYRQDVNIRLKRAYKTLMNQNPPRSWTYINAMLSTVRLNPAENLPMLKDWIILYLIPRQLYNTYKSLK